MGTPGGIQGVTFGPRFGARLIDLFLHFFVSVWVGLVTGFAIGLYAGVTHQSAIPMLQSLGHSSMWNYAFALLGSWAYHTMCDGIGGCTLGKRILSMAVVQEDGTPCRFGSAIKRNLAYYFDALFFGLVGYFAMQKTPQQQRYGDQWGDTVVCKRELVAPQNLRSGGRVAAGILTGIAVDAAFLGLGLLTNLLA